jgi:hypothetical protein
LLPETGSVDQESVPRLLVELSGSALTGSVEIHEDSGRASTLYLRQGWPVDRLDLVLVEAGLLTSADIARAQAAREGTGKLMGQVLQELGLVQQSGLWQALQLQLRRKVMRLFASPEATFAISHADHPFGRDQSSPGAALDARTLVFPGVRASYDWDRLTVGLAELTGRRVRLAPVGAAQLNELGFDATHAPLLLQLRRSGFDLPEEWIRRREGGPRAREARAVLLSLHYLGLLEVPGVSVPPSRTTTPLPEMDPVHLYMLAQQLFRDGDLVRAEEAFQVLARIEASQQRARAFIAWIQFWKKQGAGREGALTLTIQVLREIVRADPTFAMGYYFIGELFKLGDDLNKAENAFRAAINHDPALVEAQRELRSLIVRRTSR